jgi:hypothetical protein
MVLVLAGVALAALLVLALVLSLRAGSEPTVVAEDASIKLPAGAEAAIWSIVEAVPDPRNHLALTRDLTGEVRITGTPLDPALRTGEGPAVTFEAGWWAVGSDGRRLTPPAAAASGWWNPSGDTAPAERDEGGTTVRTLHRAS